MPRADGLLLCDGCNVFPNESKKANSVNNTPSPYTLEYVRNLTAPVVLIPVSFFKEAFHTFAPRHHGYVKNRMSEGVLPNGAGDNNIYLDPGQLVTQKDLSDFMHEVGMKEDPDFAELYLICCMNARMTLSASGYFLDADIVLRNAITQRVHHIIEKRPEFLHPNLRVSNDVEGANSVLRCIVGMRVALDLDRLVSMAATPGPGQEMLKLAMMEDNGPEGNVVDYAFKLKNSCMSSITALLRSGCKMSGLNGVNIPYFVDELGKSAASSDWQFLDAITLLREIQKKQDDAVGDGHRIAFHCDDALADTPKEVVDLADFTWSSTQRIHPVVALISAINHHAAHQGFSRAHVAESMHGFPGDRILEMSELVNAILEPECRLPLECVSGLNSLKLITLGAAASQDNQVMDFWNRAATPGSGDSTAKNSSKNILMWALEKPDSIGRFISNTDLAPIHDRLVEVIGVDQVAKIRAQVLHREMAAVISASTSSAGPVVEAPVRRRRPVAL